jgi:hypothetical protein
MWSIKPDPNRVIVLLATVAAVEAVAIELSGLPRKTRLRSGFFAYTAYQQALRRFYNQ